MFLVLRKPPRSDDLLRKQEQTHMHLRHIWDATEWVGPNELMKLIGWRTSRKIAEIAFIYNKTKQTDQVSSLNWWSRQIISFFNFRGKLLLWPPKSIFPFSFFCSIRLNFKNIKGNPGIERNITERSKTCKSSKFA